MPLAPRWYHAWPLRVLLHPYARLVLMVLTVGLLYRGLRVYPWWLWLPACFLGAVAAMWLCLVGAYGYQKATYQQRARDFKLRRRAPREDCEL